MASNGVDSASLNTISVSLAVRHN